MNETATLTEYVATVDLADVPADSISYAKRLVLDNLGCQISGVRLPWSQRVYEAIVPLAAPGEASLVSYGMGVAPDTAAFLNGSSAHCKEFDDTHLKSPTRPGAVAVPAAVAVAEHVGADGATLLAGVIASYESMLRISYAASPNLFGRGHHPPVAVGPFGAAAAAARIMGMSPAETQGAFAVAGSFSGGQMEYSQTGGSVKRLHGGIPAGAGVRATLLAQAGVTGPPTILEGKRGFLAAFAGEFDAGWLVRNLGSEYLLKEVALKMYSCAHVFQNVLDGIGDLLAEKPFGPDDVESIVVWSTNESVVDHVGTIVEPEDILSAQFSVPFSVSMYLHDMPCQWRDYENVDLKDPKLLEFAHRVSMKLRGEKAEFSHGYTIVVTFRDGSERSIDVLHAKGEPERPASTEEVENKFLGLAEPIMGIERAKQVAAMVNDLENLGDVRTLGKLMR